MDTDWCLTCNKHIEVGLYCSYDCQGSSIQIDDHDDSSLSDSSSISQHDPTPQSHWSGWHHNAEIAAWAASIPPGPPSASEISLPETSSHSPTTTVLPSPSITVTYRPPELLRPHRPVPPTLCMSMPRPTPSKPSHPIVAPQQQHSVDSSVAHSGDTASTGQTSLLSAVTDSSLATPASANPLPFSSRKPSMLGSIASHVRSWVSPSPQALSTPPPKQQSSRLPRQPEITVVSQSLGFSALNLASSLDDDVTPIRFSSTFVVSTREKLSQGHLLALEVPTSHNDHPSYRARGRKTSRAVA